MLHHSENLFIKYHEKNFSIKIYFLRAVSIEQDYLSNNGKNSVFGVLNKNSYFSTESAKEQFIIYNFRFHIALYSPKSDNKHPSEMSTTAVTLL